MAAPIQSPAKCEVPSVIKFLNAKGECPAEIHKQIVAVYGKVINRQNVTKWCREFPEGMTDVHDEHMLLLDSCLQTCMTYTTAECTVNKLLMMDRRTARNM
jgi:hypothetical protein